MLSLSSITTITELLSATLALLPTTTEMLSPSPYSSLKGRGQGSCLLTRGLLGEETLAFQMALRPMLIW
ncbi:hypothetical protein Ancab_019584 [Ancistrocladus abbreviatus]